MNKSKTELCLEALNAVVAETADNFDKLARLRRIEKSAKSLADALKQRLHSSGVIDNASDL